VPEAEATGKVKATYDDIRDSLRTPNVSLLFRVLAGYPDFLEVAWQQLKPNVITVYFETRADEIRSRAVEGTARLGAPPRPDPPAAAVLRVYHYVYPKLLLAACAMRCSLTGQYPLLLCLPSSQKRQIRTGVPADSPQIEEVEPAAAGERVAGVFSDIQATLSSEFVGGGFSALAQWPDYLGWAWQSLKPVIASPEYESLRSELRRTAEAALAALPFRIDLSPHVLRLAGLNDSDLDGVRRVLDRFYAYSPGQVANVAFLSIGADGQYGASRSPFPPA
jgi:hypothetical protein